MVCRRLEREEVLNACRHHGKEDAGASPTPPLDGGACSTPVGITARRTDCRGCPT